MKCFEAQVDKSHSKTSGLAFFNKNRNKVCSTITADFIKDLQMNPFVWKYVNASVKLYGKKYPLNQSMNVRKYIKIKKTIKN